MRLISKQLPDWVRKDDIIGNINISQNEIIYSSRQINLSNCSAIILNTNKYQNQDSNRKVYNGLGFLKIKLETEEEIIIKFVIQNEKEVNELNKILRHWYINNLPLKEYSVFTKDKILLQQSGWCYEELQILKKELGISSMY